MTERMYKTNANTDLLKVVAVTSMVIDHVGAVLLPEVEILRWIGRLAFPLFCYCLTIGLMHTRSVPKYLLRLLLMAVVSQPLFVWAFYSENFVWSNLFQLNTLFTLLLSLYAMWGYKEGKWLRFFAGLLALSVVPCDYSIDGVILMLIFYCFRKKPVWGCICFVVFFLQNLYAGPVKYTLFLNIGSVAVFVQTAALLAAPLIYLPVKGRVKINKWLFYGFYPLHLLVICLVRLWL